MGKDESDVSVFAAAVNILTLFFPNKKKSFLLQFNFLWLLNTFIIVLKILIFIEKVSYDYSEII